MFDISTMVHDGSLPKPSCQKAIGMHLHHLAFIAHTIASPEEDAMIPVNTIASASLKL